MLNACGVSFMISISIQQVAEIVDGRFQDESEGLDGSIVGVTIDSRTVQAGQLFVAIGGGNFDGHDYIASAMAKGAGGAIAERAVSPDPAGPVILVDDTIAALGRLAAWYRRQLPARVIAITGSAGKTSTRQMLYDVLSHFYQCRQSPKSFNNHIGVPLTLLSAEMDDEMLLVELGTNSPGEIAALSQMVNPDIAAITFIGPVHLAGFGTVENVLKEKASIAAGLKAGGRLYVNGDQPQLVEYVKANYDVELVTVGTCAGCDVVGSDLKIDGPGGVLVIEGRPVAVSLPGRAALANSLTVWSVCRDFNVSLSDFAGIVGQLTPVSMRMELQKAGSVTIVNDCYNANPASMANALEYLGSLRESDNCRLIFVSGTMGELGEQSAQLHYELGSKAVDCGVDVVLSAGDFAADVTVGVIEGKRGVMAQAFENTDQLCDNLHKYIQPDDIVLVKGSRLAGLEKAVRRLNELFGNQ